MADAKPGPFGLWRQMRRERKAREAMTAQVPDEIAAEITADAAGLNDPQPARGRSESLREFLQRTPHRYAYDAASHSVTPPCLCGLRPLDEIHSGPDLLDTRAYVAARLEEIRDGWPVPEPELPAPDLSGMHEFIQDPEVSTVSVCVCGQWPDHPCHLPEPPGSPLPGQPGYRESAHEDDGQAVEPATVPPPGGVLGYLVAYTYRADGGVEGVTHTTLMDLESARKEAKAHGRSAVRRWFPVELRRVDGG